VNKNEKEKFEKWATTQLTRYYKTLKLDAYDPPALKYRPEAVKDDDILQVPSQYPYKWIVIYYGDKAVELKKRDPNVLRRCMLHELVHVVLDELVCKASKRTVQSEIDDSMEATIEHLTTVIKSLTDGKT
jgi:hypothetical protein